MCGQLHTHSDMNFWGLHRSHCSHHCFAHIHFHLNKKNHTVYVLLSTSIFSTPLAESPHLFRSCWYTFTQPKSLAKIQYNHVYQPELLNQVICPSALCWSRRHLLVANYPQGWNCRNMKFLFVTWVHLFICIGESHFVQWVPEGLLNKYKLVNQSVF